MLPKPLTEDICSLRSNVERLAFSAIWEMTQDAQILNVRYSPIISPGVTPGATPGTTPGVTPGVEPGVIP